MTILHRFEGQKLNIPDGTYIDKSLAALVNIPIIFTRIDSCDTSRITFDTALTDGTVNYRVLRNTPVVSITGTSHRICMSRGAKISINGHSFEQID